MKVKKDVIAFVTCPKCYANIEGGQKELRNHNCIESLAKRNKKFDKHGNITDMTEKEIKEYKSKPKKDPEKPAKPNDIIKAENDIIKVSESVLKQLNTVKTDKEFSAVKERFDKALEKFIDKAEIENTPEIVTDVEKKLKEVEGSFTKEK